MAAVLSDPEAAEIAAALGQMNLLAGDEQPAIARLSGGISCDVYLVDLTDRAPFVVKHALSRLRVSADWRAPPERSATEVAWLEFAAAVDPHCVPRVLGQDAGRYIFAMSYFPPGDYPVWKAELAAGKADAAFAARVGTALARLHAASAGREDIARAFDNGAQFHALRLDPYLLFTAQKHPDLAAGIGTLAENVARARIALMQGDVSPKNILCGKDGAIFLDAETACYGDPAFDLAFCLNHLLLKCVWHPEHAGSFLNSFIALKDAYRAGVNWEDPAAMMRRTAQLLGALLLARIDGKSPVEYLTDERDRAFVRAAARKFLADPQDDPGAMAKTWGGKIAAR